MAANRTMISASWSLQRADHGEQPYWAVLLLASCLGQIGLPGAGFGFGYGSASGIADRRQRSARPAWKAHRTRSTVRFRPPASRSACCIPASLTTSTAAEPLSGHQARVLGRRQSVPSSPGPEPVALSFSPAADHRRARAVVDGDRTPRRYRAAGNHNTREKRYRLRTARSVRHRHAKGNRAGRRSAQRLRHLHRAGAAARFADEFTKGRDEMGWLRHLYDTWRESIRSNAASIPDFDRFWADGYLEIPKGADEYLMFENFRADPAANKLTTPSGRIELFSENRRLWLRQLSAAPDLDRAVGMARRCGSANLPLHLISSQPRYKLHSQMDAGPISARGKIGGREAVTMNPDDARAARDQGWRLVRIHNARGACLAGVVLTDTLSPGVAKLSCGAWYDPAGAEDGAICAHGNANVLTHDRGSSKLSQGPSPAPTWSRSNAGPVLCPRYAHLRRRRWRQAHERAVYGFSSHRQK